MIEATREQSALDEKGFARNSFTPASRATVTRNKSVNPCEHYDGDIRFRAVFCGAHGPDELDPVDRRKVPVGDDEIRHEMFEVFQCLDHVRSGVDITESVHLEDRCDQVADLFGLVDDECG